MSKLARLFCGITLITVPSIAYGGFFLLQLLSGWTTLELTPFQSSMFRAGHAHAGVLVIFSLLAQLVIDYTAWGKGLKLALRIGFPLAAILISGGFFLSAIGPGRTEPGGLIVLLYTGVGIFVFSLLTLGIGLLRKLPADREAAAGGLHSQRHDGAATQRS